MIKRVHLVFKTHFDYGFTDLAATVLEDYFTRLIPQVLETARRYREEGRDNRYVWTTGSWLIHEYLDRAAPGERKRMERGILAGDIVWHACPFTTHTELMDAGLFRYGLSLSKRLDERFGRTTIAAKMTDVPGHTRAMVPLLAEADIQFLHIGVNEAATPPSVPQVFNWHDKQTDTSVLVMYQHTYGSAIGIPVAGEALAFGFTEDNIGPQSPEQINAIYQATRDRFPLAEVGASSLDVFAERLVTFKDSFPVVTDEIGDTWIQGIGSDPWKVSHFRALCRLRSAWLQKGIPKEEVKAFADFSKSLLCVPEHTWGLDEKTHLNDDEHYERSMFDRVRSTPPFRRMEASWKEQRAYISDSLAILAGSDIDAPARIAMGELMPGKPDLAGCVALDVTNLRFDMGQFEVGFNPANGALAYLVDRRNGRQWAGDGHLFGYVGYQTFDQLDYDRYLDQYLVRTPWWALPDNSKAGIDKTYAESRWWRPRLANTWMQNDGDSCRVVLKLELPQRCSTHYGGPKGISVTYQANRETPELQVTLQWFDKSACRLPEASWFSFVPITTDAGWWQLLKMGECVNPREVVRNGNRSLHAVGQGVRYQDAGGRLEIDTLDTALVAPGNPSLLNFTNELPDADSGMHFCLHNNVWGTNYPMWYGDNALFRFVVRLA